MASRKRDPWCIVRLAGPAYEVFDKLRLMAIEEGNVPELRDIVYEADPVCPFPLEMALGDWAAKAEGLRRSGRLIGGYQSSS